jgi:hypothetical protein|tara:strand:+ start:37 stop:945 length:909 start_codon:yes stop_codon:yes gene_type:complete
LGESTISGEKRKKDEPFNPFARDASAQRNKRMSERSQAQRRNAPAPKVAPRPEQNTQSAHNELAKKRQEALSRLGTQEQKSKPKPQPQSQPQSEVVEEPTFTTSVEKQETSAPKVSREDRMAELRRKSEESRKNAKAQRNIAAAVPVDQVSVETEPVIEFVSAEQTSVPAHIQPAAEKVSTDMKSRNDVFKTIQTEVAKPSSDRRRKRRRGDKKGGGRQKQEKKLNRQKYLEYKYAARAILDDDSIAEEQRSNVLGQVWAKGERMGVTDSLEFIELKVEEEILPRQVADKLRDLVSRMTTRR